jgi:hypothetical protein
MIESLKKKRKDEKKIEESVDFEFLPEKNASNLIFLLFCLFLMR